MAQLLLLRSTENKSANSWVCPKLPKFLGADLVLPASEAALQDVSHSE